MNTTLLHAGEEGRYDEFRVDGSLVVYDRENPSAWIHAESPTTIET